ncbi:MAG TPA: hypothetical protein P5572_04625 [Phycisphaerae bacterium]|nr:hypothetical protein [Phycisphaerales bacterium]HRX84285.1 hypothetical protein [Phycisphaerae bacterium]
MKRIGLLAGACLLLAGCTSYYRVTDVSTQQNYYTKNVQRKSSGAVVFKDSRTGSEVTLQSSKITKVNKETFEHENE